MSDASIKPSLELGAMNENLDLPQARILVDGRFPELIKSWHPLLKEQCSYVLMGAGKALRPALLFWVYKQLTRSPAIPNFVIDWAVAIEMIHTYSLVHDDLPAMDNDDFRRGKPTLHKLYGEAAAILVGDSLLTGAFEVLAASQTDARLNVEAIQKLSIAAGAAGMISGQMRDIFESSSFDPNDDLRALERVHLEKTGALIATALEIGGLAAGATPTLRGQLATWGLKLGLLFQVVDDVLDVTGDLKSLGKTPGKDQNLNKRSYVSLLGVEGAREKAQSMRIELLVESQSFESTLNCDSLVDFIFQRKH